MNIAIFYHTILRGGPRNIRTNSALSILSEQMDALERSGLLKQADEFHVGVNGGDADAMVIAQMVGNKAQVAVHGKDAKSEIPTMNLIREWLPGHSGWAVLYHQMKSVSTPGIADGWRRRMERNVVWNWRNCISLLRGGHEACGSHWLTPEQNPGTIASPFFGGTFWWARSDYLMRLPPLPPDTWENRYEAETWIGKGNPRPRIHDFHPGWPSNR